MTAFVTERAEEPHPVFLDRPADAEVEVPNLRVGARRQQTAILEILRVVRADHAFGDARRVEVPLTLLPPVFGTIPVGRRTGASAAERPAAFRSTPRSVRRRPPSHADDADDVAAGRHGRHQQRIHLHELDEMPVGILHDDRARLVRGAHGDAATTVVITRTPPSSAAQTPRRRLERAG